VGDSYREELHRVRKAARKVSGTVGRATVKEALARTAAVRRLAQKKKARQIKLW